MPLRVIAAFLALVLLWSGLSTIEVPSALAQPSPFTEQRVVTLAAAPVASHEGSVDQHYLDDLPWQAQGDSPAETLAMLPALLRPTAPSQVMAQPHAFMSAAAHSPYLAGPLRPPCSDALTG